MLSMNPSTSEFWSLIGFVTSSIDTLGLKIAKTLPCHTSLCLHTRTAVRTALSKTSRSMLSGMWMRERSKTSTSIRSNGARKMSAEERYPNQEK